MGRITAHVNHLYEETHNDDETGFFGFFECIYDENVANSLFNAAEKWLGSKGKTVMNGPQSFSIYDAVGFEVYGIDERPTIGIFHFAPYYMDLALSCGFSKCIDWHCVLVQENDVVNNFTTMIKDKLYKKSNITFKTLNKREIKKRAKEVKYILNKAWENNWGHVPLTDSQFNMFFDEIRQIIIPELTIFAEIDGKTVGFSISIPDANPGLQMLDGRLYPWRIIKLLRSLKKTKRLRTIIMGVLPEYRGRMIDTFFYLKTIETGLKMGYTESDCSLIVETNKKLLNSFKRINGKIYKTYRLYERPIRTGLLLDE